MKWTFHPTVDSKKQPFSRLGICYQVVTRGDGSEPAVIAYTTSEDLAQSIIKAFDLIIGLADMSYSDAREDIEDVVDRARIIRRDMEDKLR